MKQLSFNILLALALSLCQGCSEQPPLLEQSTSLEPADAVQEVELVDENIAPNSPVNSDLNVNSNPTIEPTPVKKLTGPKIAIIIDDLGYKWDEGQQVINIAHPITLAIIPFTPFGKTLAEQAQKHSHEVMLHAPMEVHGERPWEKGLETGMNQEELGRTLGEMLLDIPHAKGVNNHGGSRFTENLSSMEYLLDDLSSRHLYFVDSRTSSGSTAAQAALTSGIAFSKRDVFLDNDLTSTAIEFQFDRLRSRALSQGYAIAIGHPHQQTLEILRTQLSQLHDEGFELVNVSSLLSYLDSNSSH